MITQHNLSREKYVRQDLNLAESKNKNKKVLASTTDYYTEWTTENKSVEKPKTEKADNPDEVPTDKVYPRRNVTNKHKRISWNNDTNASASYNEIYNRAELYNFP